jgi:hypothetical protein
LQVDINDSVFFRRGQSRILIRDSGSREFEDCQPEWELLRAFKASFVVEYTPACFNAARSRQIPS